MDRLRSALSAIGAVLTGTGVLILLFVAYQLWGTGIYTAQAQSDLKSDFQKALETTTTSSTAPPQVSTTTTAPPPSPPPEDGVTVAHMVIPKIGVDKYVVEGVGVGALRKAPGHYPTTPLPGELGNAAIAGHRTTYGAPFNRLDELVPGDEIKVATLKGNFTYQVTGTTIVKPDQTEVLDGTPDARLTLTTCHPKYSAAKRLVVMAALVPGQVATPPAPLPAEPGKPGEPGEPGSTVTTRDGPTAFEDAGLASDHSKMITTVWGTAAFLVGLAWWLAIRKWRRWPYYLGGVLPFLAVLFMFYAHLERLLPANF